MIEPKVPVVAAAVGFVLSFLIGLFSGAAFPVFLLRAFGMALFFAIGSVVVYILSKKFLPELFDYAEEIKTSNQPPEFGSMVDMTIGDEDEMPYSSVSEFKDDESTPDFEDEFLNQDEQKRYTDDLDQKGMDEPTDSVQKASQQSPLQEQQEKSASAMTSASYAPQKKGGSGGLDVLPDLQDFMPEEINISDDVEESEISFESSGTGFSVPDVSVDGIETDTMAKAIRTILSRDN